MAIKDYQLIYIINLMLFKKILTNDKGIVLCVPNIRVIIHP